MLSSLVPKSSSWLRWDLNWQSLVCKSTYLTITLLEGMKWRHIMNDLLYIGLTLLFFALTYGLIVVCERLMEDKS